MGAYRLLLLILVFAITGVLNALGIILFDDSLLICEIRYGNSFILVFASVGYTWIRAAQNRKKCQKKG